MIDMLEGHGKLSIRKLLDSCKPSNPQEMTDQQLNVALAELTGFPADKLTPNYCNDPAASLEVQAAAIKANDRQYAINLAKRLEWDGDDLEYSDNDVFSYTGVTVFMLASPRERAQAAYMTLSSHPLREDINE
jgi:hypothetical protein